MFKKVTAIFLVMSVMFLFGACSIKNNSEKEKSKTRTTTEQVTLIRNSFKDALPSYKFKNEIKETYVDGMTYKFTVKCSQDECDKYTKKVKKEGFTVNPAEGTNYYSARTEDYYSVEITYIGEILTVLCKRV